MILTTEISRSDWIILRHVKEYGILCPCPFFVKLELLFSLNRVALCILQDKRLLSNDGCTFGQRHLVLGDKALHRV